MKTKQFVQIAAIVLLSILNHQLSTCFAQGSLTPPGTPAPTMKSLDQIEARTPITNTASLVTISQPGSYYLTANLTVSTGDGIDINTNDVTLDLNGFTIRSTAASATGTGILLNNGWTDITIGNGHIRGGGTNNGSGVFSKVATRKYDGNPSRLSRPRRYTLPPASPCSSCKQTTSRPFTYS